MLGKLCAATLVADIVDKQMLLQLLSSTCFDVNESLNETSFALVLAR
jgi:hypothetical protein